MSTDEKGKPSDVKQTLSIFHKVWNSYLLIRFLIKPSLSQVLEMEGLAFYWNPKSPLYANFEEVARLQKFQSEIATKIKSPDGYNYSKSICLSL